MLERRAIEARINASAAQQEQEAIDLERLRNLLNQVYRQQHTKNKDNLQRKNNFSPKKQ